MRLSPLTSESRSSKPTYPRRCVHTPSWLQRAVAVASIAFASMGLAACDGLRVNDDEEIVYLAGDIAEPSWPFICGEEPPESPLSLYAYETHMGNLCGEDTAWSRFDVNHTAVYRFSLLAGSEHASIALISPEDEQKAQLDADAPTLDIELTTGQWLVAATAVDPIGYPLEYFELTYELIP